MGEGQPKRVGWGAALAVIGLLTVACGNGGSGPTIDSMTVNGQPFAAGNLATSEPWEEAVDASGSVTISWQIPTETAEGEPLEMVEIEGYRLYFHGVDDEALYCVEIDDPLTTEYQVTGLEAGEYAFTLTTVDSEGRESEPSNVMSKEVS